jgi:DNA replication protein DnaC
MFAQAMQGARRYAEDAQGWLVLVGPSGCGKTHLAAAVANECLRRGEPALFIFVPDFLDHLRGAYAPNAEMAYDALFQQIREAPLLVLDDLGAQASTPWAQEKLFQVLNHRFAAHLPTVVTVGVPMGDLEPHVQSRLTDPEVSRVWALAVEDGRWSVNDALALPLFQEMTFDSFHPRRQGSVELGSEQRKSLEMAYKLARTYAGSPEGWLVFMGENGVGKTHLAAAIAHACRERGTSVLFLVVPDLLDHLRYTFRPDSDVSYDQLFEEVKRVPLLVLDDLGAHGTSPWAREKLYQIINYRYNARLPLVVTTNLSLDELEKAEPRIASRLADARFSVPFHIYAPNYGVDQPSADTAARRGARRRSG